jgi:hypothetical protein
MNERSGGTEDPLSFSLRSEAFASYALQDYLPAGRQVGKRNRSKPPSRLAPESCV